MLKSNLIVIHTMSCANKENFVSKNKVLVLILQTIECIHLLPLPLKCPVLEQTGLIICVPYKLSSGVDPVGVEFQISVKTVNPQCHFMLSEA